MTGHVPSSGVKRNTDLITNLPYSCTVELPCYVDFNGIQPVRIGDLPMQFAVVCRASMTIQEMVVEAALTGDKDLARQAMLMDPLTGVVCTTFLFAGIPGLATSEARKGYRRRRYP